MKRDTLLEPLVDFFLNRGHLRACPPVHDLNTLGADPPRRSRGVHGRVAPTDYDDVLIVQPHFSLPRPIEKVDSLVHDVGTGTSQIQPARVLQTRSDVHGGELVREL